jgi:hypothetical protein
MQHVSWKNNSPSQRQTDNNSEFKRLFSYLTAVFQGYSFMARVRLLLDKKLAN